MNHESDLFRFWAKTSHDKEKENAYHPLLCHMIDVAVVARLMWREVLPPAARRRVGTSFGLDEDSEHLAALVSFIAGLHDLGKASPPFTLRGKNEKNGATRRLLTLYDNTNFSADAPHFVQVKKASEAPHGFVTAVELPAILQNEFGFPPSLANSVATMIGGHHGTFPRSEDINKIGNQPPYVGNQHWREARRMLALKLAEVLGVPRSIPKLTTDSPDNATTMLLAGLVSVADWIGSNSTYFQCRVEDFTAAPLINAEEYLSDAEKNARKALARLGWSQWPEATQAKEFFDLFPTLKNFPPRHLQTIAAEVAGNLRTPGIVVVEAPTGEGKTEAAMYLADSWNAALNQRGLYFALPTQATSDQMFGRVRQFLDKRFIGGNVLLQLLHGHASLSSYFELLLKEGGALHELALREIYDDAGHQQHDECTPSVVAAEWFTYRKRGLLAPFGVGTVDQALMAVLQTKHVFVRLFGLSHKTIIVDEVHAYDAYMSTLLERLLEWLAALGSPVILLSATLPKQRRDDLLHAYRKGLGATQGFSETRSSGDGEDIYPRISWATAQESDVRHIQTSEQNSRTLFLHRVDGRLPQEEGFDFALGRQLREALKDGGCAAVICNTVQRAQDVYRALSLDPFFQGNADDSSPKLDLLHARFRYCDRSLREQRTLRRFGKPGEKVEGQEVRRPRCAVLVSTQIIEQSLDLDFDLMITDLAPVDLILQRAGRLHRHQRDKRPPDLRKPTLWVCEPEKVIDGVPDFGVSQYVYDPHILLRSWLTLENREQIIIPDDVEAMIEDVYDLKRTYPGELDDLIKEHWRATLQDYESQQREELEEARDRWIKHPQYRGAFWRIAADLREEDTPEFHRAHQALTRLAEPSVQVVCLFGTRETPFLDEQRSRPISLQVCPSLERTKELLQQSLTLASKYVALALMETEVPAGWRQSALLRNHRVLVFDENKIASAGSYQFCLDPDLGLQIINSKRRLSDA